VLTWKVTVEDDAGRRKGAQQQDWRWHLWNEYSRGPK